MTVFFKLVKHSEPGNEPPVPIKFEELPDKSEELFAYQRDSIP
jgi:hypothetical protein